MMTSPVDQTVASGVRESRSPVRALLSAMRPLQAPKNGLVLVPLIFSVNIWFAVDDVSGMFEIVLRAVGATAAFTLLSGAVYLINDLADVGRDRAHPIKRKRAIASGALSIRAAYLGAFGALLIAGGNLIGDQHTSGYRLCRLSDIEHRLHPEAETRRDIGRDKRCVGIRVARVRRLRRHRRTGAHGSATAQRASTSMFRRGSI